MDSFARGHYTLQGRRAHLTGSDRERTDREIKKLVNKDLPGISERRYGSSRDSKATFYTSKLIARELVMESVRWMHEALTYQEADEKSESRSPRWPTQEAKDIVAKAT